MQASVAKSYTGGPLSLLCVCSGHFPTASPLPLLLLLYFTSGIGSSWSQTKLTLITLTKLHQSKQTLGMVSLCSQLQKTAFAVVYKYIKQPQRVREHLRRVRLSWNNRHCYGWLFPGRYQSPPALTPNITACMTCWGPWQMVASLCPCLFLLPPSEFKSWAVGVFDVWSLGQILDLISREAGRMNPGFELGRKDFSWRERVFKRFWAVKNMKPALYSQ